MSVVSAAMLALAFWLALLFGAQTEAWSWGPAFLALGLGLVAGAFVQRRSAGPWGLLLVLLAAGLWLAGRCLTSPVAEFAWSDGALVLGLLASAWLGSGLRVGGGPIALLHAGLALAVIGNAVVALMQWHDPAFTWPYANRPVGAPTGFFGHYNYLSNFVVGAGFLFLGRACFSRDPGVLRGAYAVGFLAAVVCVLLSGSRGGLLTLGVALVAFLVAAALLGWRRKSRWMPVVATAIPLVVVGGAALGWVLITKIQERRDQPGEMTVVVDNYARLNWIGLALRTSTEHPVAGGGSRSYSWERNRHWDTETDGLGRENERFVHNELVQVATDYGWLGAGLVVACLVPLFWIPLAGLCTGEKSTGDEADLDAVRVGLLAAASGVLFQANISFVFHLLPSTLLLGLFFGLALGLRRHSAGSAVVPVLRLSGGVVLAVCCLGFGWCASDVLRRVWPVLYANPSMAVSDPAAAMAALDVAARRWTGHRIHEERGHLGRQLAAREGLDTDEVRRWNEEAERSYLQAARLHPHHAGLAVNRGNALSALGKEAEARAEFERAIELQGGLEAMFRGRYFLALHLYTTWFDRWQRERRASEALWHFRRARDLLEEAEGLTQLVERRGEVEPLLEGIGRAIGFLEAAKVEAKAPAGVVPD